MNGELPVDSRSVNYGAVENRRQQLRKLRESNSFGLDCRRSDANTNLAVPLSGRKGRWRNGGWHWGATAVLESFQRGCPCSDGQCVDRHFSRLPMELQLESVFQQSAQHGAFNHLL